jgi:hypothetical protein
MHQLAAKLFQGYDWSSDIIVPNTRQFDSVFTNRHEFMIASNFTTHMASLWNGGPKIGMNGFGLWSYCDSGYITNTLMKHAQECTVQRAATTDVFSFRRERPSIFLSSCPKEVSQAPDFIILESATEDERWMRGDVGALGTYAQLLSDAIQTWQSIAPRARIAVRGAVPKRTNTPAPPVTKGPPTTKGPSTPPKNSEILLDMMNRVACGVAHKHGVTCLDPYPLLYSGKDELSLDAAQSLLYTFMCPVKEQE